MPLGELDGSFRKAVQGIKIAKEKVAVTINTTVMAENVNEIVSMVKLAKDLNTKISVAIAHEYCNANASSPASDKIPKIAHKLMEMKREGLPYCQFNGLL